MCDLTLISICLYQHLSASMAADQWKQHPWSPPPRSPPPPDFLSQNLHSKRSQLIRMVRSSQFEKVTYGSSPCGSVATNLISVHEDVSLIPGLAQGVKDLVLL